MAGINFNRIVTVKGSSAGSIALPEAYDFFGGYAQDRAESAGIDKAAWGTIPAVASNQAAAILGVTAIIYGTSVGGDVTETHPPTPAALNSMDKTEMYVLRDNGRIGLTFDIVSADWRPRVNGIGQGIRVNVENGRLTGADFDVSDAPLGFDFDLTQYSVEGEIKKRVWCRIIEETGTAGLVRLNLGVDPLAGQGQPAEGAFEEGSQQQVTILTPYDESIATGDEILDDLGRVWTVTTSRTLNERRYLEFGCFRAAVTEPLPAA